MKKIIINISDVKYFADEHKLHIFGELKVDNVELDFGLAQSVLGSELRAEYEDVCLCYEPGNLPEFYYDENGKTIGYFQVLNQSSKTPSIGIGLLHDYQHLGYGTELLHAAVDTFRCVKKYTELKCHVWAANAASLR